MLRIAWFSLVLEPQRFQSAYYSAQVIPQLTGECEIELFLGDEDYRALGDKASSHLVFGVRAFHALRAYFRDLEKPFDIFVYQLEDEARCNFVRLAALLQPGMVFAHDVLVHDPLAYIHPGKSDIVHLSREMFPGSVMLVRNESGLRQVASLPGDGPVEVCSFPVPLSSESRAELRTTGRELLHLPASAMLIGFSGSHLLKHRLYQIFQALSVLDEGRSGIYLWLVFSSAEEQAAKALLRRTAEVSKELREKIRVVLVQSESMLRATLGACDVFVGLHFDDFHAIPLPLLTAMAVKTPVVVSDCGQAAELPATVALKIPLGAGEMESLYLVLEELLSNEALSRALSTSAIEYLEHVSPPAVVSLELSALFRKYRVMLGAGMNTRCASYLEMENKLVSQMKSELRAEEVKRLFAELAEAQMRFSIPAVGESAVKSFAWGSHE